MSDNIEHFGRVETQAERVCAVAYTLNHEQPVICTHIGDQPLFYIDEGDIDEEEMILLDELASAKMLEQELETLRDEIHALHRLPIFLPQETEESLAVFYDNTDSLTDHDKVVGDSIDDLRSVLMQSRLAAAYVNIADKHDVVMVHCDQVDRSFYDRHAGVIQINPTLGFTDQVIAAVRELRRHWQHRKGALINPIVFQPEHAVLVNRAQEADLSVSVVRIGWELQLSGYKDVWARIEDSPMSDLARSFAREAFLDFRTINDGTAAATVFEAWFLSERCRVMDRGLIQMMLADHKGYVFECPSSSKTISIELLSALGEMPFGKNYLSSHISTLMVDPIFSEVRDRANANFLWFIKFERSYKESEQSLQSEDHLSTDGVRHMTMEDDQNRNDTRKSKHQHAQSHAADIIVFADHAACEGKNSGSNSQSGRGKKRRSGSSADIIDIRYWSSE